MRWQYAWIKILVLTNIISLIFLLIVSLYYQVPQKILIKIGLIRSESESLTLTRYTYINYRQMAIHSLVNGNAGFEIVMLGDSITEWGDWNALLNRVDVANFGIGGDTASYLKYRLFDVYLANPNKCFLMIGINDLIANNDTVDNVFDNYISVIEDIREHNIEIIIQSTLYLSETASKFPRIGNNWENINVKVDNLNNLLIKYCSENDLEYINLNKILSKDKMLEEQNSPDGLHLNEIGYEKWKDIILKYL